MNDQQRTEHMVAVLTMATLHLEKEHEKYLTITSTAAQDAAARSGYKDAIDTLKTFLSGVRMGAYKTETILWGYRLLTREAGAEQSDGQPTLHEIDPSLHNPEANDPVCTCRVCGHQARRSVDCWGHPDQFASGRYRRCASTLGL